MKFLRALLFPLMPFYFLVTWLRNKLYDWGVFASKAYDLPVICVGNLSTGGTGKTPMVEYLIRLLGAKPGIAVLSRGYKRQSKGFIIANEPCTYKDIGDEPFQFYSKFKDILVAVDENRVRGIDQLIQLDAPPQVIILDDAFQHRKVRAGLNILLTAYNKPFFKNMVLPTGDLREPRSGYGRANIIIITKCPPDLSDGDKHTIIKQLQAQDHQHVFFSSIAYASDVFNGKEYRALEAIQNFTLVTGIAKPEPFVNYLKNKGRIFDHRSFPDHHNFTDGELQDLATKGLLLTTEKDYIRLSSSEMIDASNLFYLPIEFRLDQPERFEQLIKDFIRP